MSPPDESLQSPAPAAPTEVPDATLPEASMPPPPSELPAASGAPYRSQEASAPVEASHPFSKPRRPRPVLGPALSTFAALLWSFVVAGQFTTSWHLGAPLPQGIALSLVALATLAAWIAGVRRSGLVVPPARRAGGLVGRALAAFVLAFGLFLACLFAATMAGATALRDHDLLIAFGLVLLATGAAIVGPKWTSPAPPERTHRQRFALVILWIMGVLVTFVAGVDLASSG
jgi:hypothetical protein